MTVYIKILIAIICQKEFLFVMSTFVVSSFIRKFYSFFYTPFQFFIPTYL